MSDKTAELIEARLQAIHFDGHGCGTHGTNACSNCFGPSPMSAHEIGQDLARILPTLGEHVPACNDRCDEGGHWLTATEGGAA